MKPVSVVLGIKPSAYGFAWIAFSSPFSVYDCGVVEARRGDKNEQCLERVERLLRRFAAHTIVLEMYEGAGVKCSPRIVRLCRAVAALGHARGLEIAVMSRGDVKACFASVGARTRHETAAAIARSFEMLRNRLPAKRQAWEASQRGMALFDAAAAVLAHYHLGSARLFNDLRECDENTSEVEEV
jgi:hypothetical protein